MSEIIQIATQALDLFLKASIAVAAYNIARALMMIARQILKEVKGEQHD